MNDMSLIGGVYLLYNSEHWDYCFYIAVQFPVWPPVFLSPEVRNCPVSSSDTSISIIIHQITTIQLSYSSTERKGTFGKMFEFNASFLDENGNDISIDPLNNSSLLIDQIGKNVGFNNVTLDLFFISEVR